GGPAPGHLPQNEERSRGGPETRHGRGPAERGHRRSAPHDPGPPHRGRIDPPNRPRRGYLHRRRPPRAASGGCRAAQHWRGHGTRRRRESCRVSVTPQIDTGTTTGRSLPMPPSPSSPDPEPDPERGTTAGPLPPSLAEIEAET